MADMATLNVVHQVLKTLLGAVAKSGQADMLLLAEQIERLGANADLEPEATTMLADLAGGAYALAPKRRS